MAVAIASLVYTISKDFGLWVWSLVSDPADRVLNLEKKLESLEAALEQLEHIHEDVKRMVQNGEKDPQMECTKQVSGWLDLVEKLKEDVRRILQDSREQEQNTCLGGFCTGNCLSSYKLGKIVSIKLNEVEEQKTRGSQFSDMNVVQKVHEPVQEMPMDEAVGLDSTLQDVLRCLEDKHIVGLYGIGGVGKSTLLCKINNEFLKVSHDFEEVVFVMVQKPLNLELVQETIMNKLGIPSEQWSSRNSVSNAQKILRRLRGKKFLLLLDNLWEKIGLKDVGVPIPNDQNQSKLVFTTRLFDVCGAMGSQRDIEIKCLQPKEALQLFRMKVGKATLNSDQDISDLETEMVEKCCGLPLALVTVGSTMAGRNGRRDWEHEMNVFRNAPSKFQNFEDKVLKILKFSYDRLQSEKHMLCFLYCCLFPENYDIRKEELITYWIGERFLDGICEESDINGDSRHKGELMIASLKRSCLLGSGESEEFIRMHGMVRDMAWQECKEKITLLIKNKNEHRGLIRWNKVEKMALWDHSIQDLLSLLTEASCSSTEDLLGNVFQLPNLRTMICKDPMSRTLHTKFFSLMSALRLLDLSNSSVLQELPMEIGHLINLEYLNLSNTAISELPSALQNLTGLRCLILNYTTQLQKIPMAMISNFQSLEVFNKLEVVQFSYRDDYLQYLFEELECLRRIKEICIAIHEVTSLQKLLGSHRLLGCIRKLTLDDCSDLPSLELSPSLMRKMEDLELRYCNKLQGLKISEGRVYFSNLSKVVIKGCRLLSDVSWLIYARRLQTLELVFCHSLVEIIVGVGEIEENIEIFSSLLVLRLHCLPRLKSICRRALPFPSLEKIEVQDCQLLTELPFHSCSARNSLKLISGEGSWWDSLHWNDIGTKQFLSSKFVESYDQDDWLVDFISKN